MSKDQAEDDYPEVRPQRPPSSSPLAGHGAADASDQGTQDKYGPSSHHRHWTGPCHSLGFLDTTTTSQLVSHGCDLTLVLPLSRSFELVEVAWTPHALVRF